MPPLYSNLLGARSEEKAPATERQYNLRIPKFNECACIPAYAISPFASGEETCLKTSVIRYRVADFLREHPPFDVFSLEDLLAFSGTGRVIFHEDDIQLFQKGQRRDSLLWVIQQGSIELLDETPA